MMQVAQQQQMMQQEVEMEIQALSVTEQIQIDLQKEEDQIYENNLVHHFSHRQDDIQKFTTLISSHSNIYMHGSNGCGKTQFIHSCFGAKKYSIPIVYIDTTEFYSEKLIAINISQQIETQVKSYVAIYKLPKFFKRKFSFKVCKNFSALQEALTQVQFHLEQVKEANIEKFPQLGLINFFFYIVLDNVQGILKLERQKKILEKLSICQSLLNQPACFSILAINDCLIQELEIFRDQTNMFDEYLFSIFYFSPMNPEQLKSILWGSMCDAYGGECNFLPMVYDNYFSQLYQFFCAYTNNINEFIYIFRFLYPQYVEKFYKRKAEQGLNEEQICNESAKKYNVSLIELFDKPFKMALRQMQSSLYMHMNSQEDVEKEVQQQKDNDLVATIQKKQEVAMHFMNSAQRKEETYQYDQITYLEDHKKNRNFSFMQSLILIASYIAGSNKESTDTRIFEMERQRHRRNANTQHANNVGQKNGIFLLGKTKRFSLDRLLGIAQHLSSLEIEGAYECQKINHTTDFYACINTLCHEDLLKKQMFRQGGLTTEISTGADDLTSIGFKCNFDHTFVQEVAEKINFTLSEYLFRNDIAE